MQVSTPLSEMTHFMAAEEKEGNLAVCVLGTCCSFTSSASYNFGCDLFAKVGRRESGLIRPRGGRGGFVGNFPFHVACSHEGTLFLREYFPPILPLEREFA